MTAFPSYSTGTVSVADGGTTVTGSGATWSGVNVSAGDTLQIDEFQTIISDVTDATTLVIPPWGGGVQSGASYVIWKTSIVRVVGGQNALDVNNLIAGLNTRGYFVFVGPDETEPDPSLGEEGQYALQTSTGKMWEKLGGTWNFVGAFRGFGTAAPWDSGTDYVSFDIASLEGTSYLAIADSTNQTPPNATYWVVLAAKGDGFNITGAWDSGTAYLAGDVVSLNGSSYACILAHSNHTPPNGTYWELLVQKGDTGPAAWTAPAAWVTATAYTAVPPASVVVQAGETYVCLTSHTSGTFATDLAASKWIKVAQKGTGDLLSTNNGSDFANKDQTLINLGTIPYLKNALINGAMDIWQRGTSVSCPASARTFLADRWFVNPGGAAVTTSRANSVLPTNARSRFALQVAGAASVTTVNIGQRIEAANIPQIKRTVVFQAQIYNGTGSSFSPSLLLGTPAAEDDFTTVTNRLTQVLGACANAQYTQVSFSADISGYTNIDKGLQVEIQIPTGILLATKDVKITEVSLQPGSLPTIFERLPVSMTLGLCLPYYQKSFPYATTPAQNLGNDGAIVTVTAGTGAGAGAESVKFLPPMRATPTITTYNPSAANANWWDTSGSASRAVAAVDVTEKGLRLTVNATTTAAAQHFIQWQAVAEL